LEWVFIIWVLAIGLCNAQVVNTSKVKENLQLIQQEAEALEKERAKQVLTWSLLHNSPTEWRDNKGGLWQVYAISENGTPLWRTTSNASAAITTKAADLKVGGRIGSNLNGRGLAIGIWDGGGVRLSHREFVDRAFQKDVPTTLNDNHATHVAGTMVAAGINPTAKGMADGAILWAHDWNNDNSEMAARAAEGMLISNHSYAGAAGWRLNGSIWEWLGDTTVNDTLDYLFGYYATDTRFWDRIAEQAPNYLIVKSAGNNRNQLGPNTGARYKIVSVAPSVFSTRNRRQRAPFYDCIPTEGTAKNILTVGAVSPVTNYTGPASVNITPVSSWGPTDDGRIKPDVVAKGQGMFSTGATADDNYYTSGGTSMSAPNVSGTLLLVQQLYEQVAGKYLRNSTLKGLTIHTARECGPAEGPDYMYGWGLVDAGAMADVIIGNKFTHGLVVKTLVNNAVFDTTINVTATTGNPLVATICWTDPAATVIPRVANNRTPKLVNDLDIRLISPTGVEYFPYILDPANPSAAATKADNFRDNVEKIFIGNVTESGAWRIRITHKGTLTNGAQTYGLAISGTQLPAANTLLFTNPSGSIQAFTGIPRAVHFRKSFANAVNLELWQNGSFLSTLASNLQGPAYQWTPNADLDTIATYQLKVVSAANSDVFSFSGNIKLKPSQTVINSFLPTNGPVGTTVTLRGVAMHLISILRMNGVNIPFTFVSPSEIRANIPFGAVSGVFSANNSLGLPTESSTEFTVNSLPFLCSPYAFQRGTITPTSNWQSTLCQKQGTYVFKFRASTDVIYQFETCDNNGQNTLLRVYDSTTSTLAYQAPNDNGPLCTGTASSFSWPALRNTTYYVLLTDSACGILTKDVALRYRVASGVRPTYSGMSPVVGYSGTEVLISGTNLQEVNTISIGTLQCVITSKTDTLIRMLIPEGADTGMVRIAAGTATFNAGIFTVLYQTFGCGRSSINAGNLPIFSTNWLSYAKAGVRGTKQYFNFQAAAGAFYSISTCDMGSIDTEIRIYRAGQTAFDGYLDDNGPFCETRASSLTFRAPTDGTYYVVFSEWPCLGFTTDTLKYSLRSNFSVAPVVNYILPTSGVVGDTITIFGDNLLENNGLHLGNIPINPLPFADNSVMRIVIPFNATSNNIAFRHPDGDVLSPEVLYVCYSSTAQINGGNPIGFLCNGNTIRLRATAAGFNNFVWNTGETTSEIEVTNPGIYSVRGVNPACTSLTSNIVNVQQVPNSTVSLVLFENVLTATTTTANGVFEWFRNDTLINVQSGSQLTVPKNGVYVVRYTSESGCVATDSINVVLSVLGKKIEAPFKLYPNPANNSFQISSDAMPANSQVVIANMAGVTLATFPYEIGKAYPISTIKAGTYSVSIQHKKSSKQPQVLGSQLLLVVK
jgi:hypothetical protein